MNKSNFQYYSYDLFHPLLTDSEQPNSDLFRPIYFQEGRIVVHFGRINCRKAGFKENPAQALGFRPKFKKSGLYPEIPATKRRRGMPR
ncbi:hypothetical protein BTO30_10520 [Domibacillus antri]|uniref:Uncharacterized protein n=1 Tax=Domibacillus antri TaxID=1714264 RepID=A0A1Q8Q4C5_9BACI|nr:hypothetical protein BTO30_10520 [Domibacillus antri]